MVMIHVVTKEGELVDTLENVEDYDLTKAIAKGFFCRDLRDIIKKAVKREEAEERGEDVGEIQED